MKEGIGIQSLLFCSEDLFIGNRKSFEALRGSIQTFTPNPPTNFWVEASSVPSSLGSLSPHPVLSTVRLKMGGTAANRFRIEAPDNEELIGNQTISSVNSLPIRDRSPERYLSNSRHDIFLDEAI
ncbi:hypothetical protein CDAR_290701 [Caerostris darwini]|uniref:Uncharacterized protein n=1 Tax=Caerostris darwini TaxID=1538125 RepID=A0AAV4SUT5_9ARAC|nr:hypothetical protein CDAR_290701 [Caerostris darwini]